MTYKKQWTLVSVSDAAEPDSHVLLGMEFRHFDDVMLLLVPDGEPNDPNWYGTKRTHEGRPTRPLLLFYNGHIPPLLDALAWVERHAQDGLCGPPEPCTSPLVDYGEVETTRTVTVHWNPPNFPWLHEARLGMELGRYLDRVELLEDWTDPTEEKPGLYTFRFFRSNEPHCVKHPDVN